MLQFIINKRKQIALSAILMVIAVIFAYIGLLMGNRQQKVQTTHWQIKFETEHAARQLVSDQNTAYAEAAAHTISKDQFKDLFAESFQLFAKDMNMRDINHYTELKTITEHTIKTTLRDSITSDTTHVKAFAYTDANLNFNGYTTNDSLVASYKYYMELKIATGKKEREGFWRKITLQPFKREPIVQAVSNDSNTIITNIQSIKIK